MADGHSDPRFLPRPPFLYTNLISKEVDQVEGDRQHLGTCVDHSAHAFIFTHAQFSVRTDPCL